MFEYTAVIGIRYWDDSETVATQTYRENNHESAVNEAGRRMAHVAGILGAMGNVDGVTVKCGGCVIYQGEAVAA